MKMPLSTVLREAWRGVKTNRGAFVMSIAVQAICLLLLSLFVVVTLNIFMLLQNARGRIEVCAFIYDGADENVLMRSIKAITGVTDVRYVSKTDALLELKQDLGESSTVLDALGHNPLPASLRIQLAQGFAAPRNLDEVERKISIMPGVREVWSGRELLTKLEKLFSTALALDIAFLVIIAFAVLFVVFQSTESVIATRSREIEIMQLVGADDAMVRAPFYWEGIVQGLCGGLCAFVFSLIVYEIAITQIPQPFFPAGWVAGMNIVFGGVLGYLGADIALARFLK